MVMGIGRGEDRGERPGGGAGRSPDDDAVTGGYPTGDFDYRTATAAEILERAREMVGRTLGDLVPRAAREGAIRSGGRTRGEVGSYVEAWFGIPQNSRQEADFPGAGIELKSVPVAGKGHAATVKERLVLSMIDYEDLATEQWADATLRGKLDRLLLVFYRWSEETEIADFLIERVHLWSPDERQLAFMELDWLEVQDKVLAGEAHELSESDGLILGAATKGADGSKTRTQPRSSIPAKPRAWALKQPFMRALHMDLTTADGPESLMETLRIRRARAFEEEVLSGYRRYVGRTVGELATELGVTSGGKGYVASVLRRAIGQSRANEWAREFAELGIGVKTIVTGSDRMPHESLSFPAFRYRELIAETWEESDLLARLQRFLLLPLVGPRGLPNAPGYRVEPAFFWSPSRSDLAGIRSEWQMFRDEIARGNAARLPTAAQTTYIHVRPKAQDSSDTDDAPIVGPVVRKGFWLNRHYLQQILVEHADRSSRPAP